MLQIRQLNTLSEIGLLRLYKAIYDIIDSEDDEENVFIEEFEENVRTVYEKKTGKSISKSLKQHMELQMV